MNASARAALALIRACLASGRFRLAAHFRERLAERGLIWADVETLLEGAVDMAEESDDPFGRAKWVVSGRLVDRLEGGVVCVIDTDNDGAITILITMYFGK